MGVNPVKNLQINWQYPKLEVANKVGKHPLWHTYVMLKADETPNFITSTKIGKICSF